MVSARDTLVIKNLPSHLSDNDKEELLKHFGAKQVKCISSKVGVNNSNKKIAKNDLFRFQNEQTAYHVLRRLHQLDVNGSCLSVEFAKEKSSLQSREQALKDFEDKEQVENEKCYKRFMDKLNAWCSDVNFKQPIPSHLRYQYPPPDDIVLLNIAKVLATVPKFYTQVLHLMNKMNLPCPFGKDILPGYNIQLFPASDVERTDSTEVENESKDAATDADDTSESEISSDDEVKKQKETIPDQIKVRKKKVINVPKFVKPLVVTQGSTKHKKTSIEEVFEKPTEDREAKRIKLSHPPPDLIEKITANVEEPPPSSSGFGFIHPISKPDLPPPEVDIRDEREEERLEKVEIICIGAEELSQNRIPEKDRSILPVFKDYAEGAPTCRLYIKNLAKTVTEDDLRYIYNRYLPKSSLLPQTLDIRLMQEGRMKGQAFVTFQSTELAQLALKETNGYLLKEKPLVVQFARSALK